MIGTPSIGYRAPCSILDELYGRIVDGNDDSGRTGGLLAGLRTARILVLDERARHAGLLEVSDRRHTRAAAALDAVERRLRSEKSATAVPSDCSPDYFTGIDAALAQVHRTRETLHGSNQAD